MQDKTYLTVERLASGAQNETWTVLRTDNDYDTRFGWQYTSKVLGMSKATIEWDIDDTIEGTLFFCRGRITADTFFFNGFLGGTYRLGYFGHHRNTLSKEIIPHQGYSSVFTVQ